MSGSSDSDSLELGLRSYEKGVAASVSAREKEEAALEQYFIPEDISPCLFTFEDVCWKPKQPRFHLPGNKKTHKPNPLFELVEEEENIVSLGLSKSSHYSSTECSSFSSSTQKSDTIIISMGDDKTHASLTSKSDLSSFPLIEEVPPRNDGLILRHINGFAKHGEMTAILGASGAGKTTLLSVLCGRNSNFTGTFSINGNQVNSTSLRRICRFVRQHDLFYEFLTVEEHLYYQAILRLGDRPEKEIRNRLLTKHFNLTRCLNVRLGGTKIKGISGGEMRRVTLATELINYPSILFCDEPTSGLDSYMAETVIRTLRVLADHGVTVVCTIHQPPTETYNLFDRVMYLADGEVAYFGQREQAQKYFESIGMPCPAYYNMADFAIHAMAIDNELEEDAKIKRIQQVHLLCEQFKDSWINQTNMEEVLELGGLKEERIQQQIKEIEEFEHHSILYRFWNTMFVCQCPTSWWTQFKTLLSRNMHIIIRDPSLTIARFFETLVLSVLVGLVFLQLGFDQSGITNRLSVVFLVMMNECFSLLFAEIQLFPAELPIIYNEVASGLYRVDAYYLAKTVAGIPVSLIFPLMGACINYYMIGFDSAVSRFVAYIGILWLVTNSTVALGHFISAMTGDLALANAFAGLTILPLVLLGGFYLQNHPIPGYLIWIKQISMFNWGYKLTIINQFSGKVFECPPAPEPCLFPDGQSVMDYAGVHGYDVALGICVLVALNLGFRIAAFVCLEIHTFRHLNKI